MARKKTPEPPAEPPFDPRQERRELLDLAVESIHAADPASRGPLLREARALVAELAADPATPKQEQEEAKANGLVDFQSRLAAKQSSAAASSRGRAAR